MERIELLWELVEREPLVRWTAVAILGLVWLTVAWLSPLPLLVAGMLVATVYVVGGVAVTIWGHAPTTNSM